MAIIENPEPELKAKWGPLAYISDDERKRFLDLPAGKLKWELKRLEKEILAMNKRKRKGRF